jgi:ParB-like chromosome segregation protein Spo0J
METFGIAEKPVVNTDNTIIGGHQRLKILKKMGYKGTRQTILVQLAKDIGKD